MIIGDKHWLKTKPVAHRGLWGDTVPENSILAYQLAVEKGFPIEIDLFLSTDGVLFCFHDDNLARLTGVDKNIFELDSKTIKSLTLNGTLHAIPTLSETLETVDGKVPLLIEIKTQPNKKIVEKVIEVLKDYKGEYALQSFNPLYIIKLKKLAPHIIRGILGAKKTKGLSAIKNFVVSKMPLNFIAKPHFISYRFSDIPLKKNRLPLLTWTVTNSEQQQKANDLNANIIFEKFLPKI